MATGSNFMLDIQRQLAARNAVEVHAFREITTDYQRCLSQLRELRVRLKVLFASNPPKSWLRLDSGITRGLCCRCATHSWTRKQRNSGAKILNCPMQLRKPAMALPIVKRQVDPAQLDQVHSKSKHIHLAPVHSSVHV